jgi:hypothetical protein
MRPSTSFGFTPISSALIKDFEDKKYQNFSISKKGHAPFIPPIEKLKKEQLIAGMAFRFFGLHNMPIYKADTTFLQERNINALPPRAIQLLGELQKSDDIVKDGCIYSNNISRYKSDLAIDIPNSHILSFSIVLKDKEVVLVYNTSKSEALEKFILLNRPSTKNSSFLETIFGYDTSSFIQVFNGRFNEVELPYIRLYLKPMQLVILKNF